MNAAHSNMLRGLQNKDACDLGPAVLAPWRAWHSIKAGCAACVNRDNLSAIHLKAVGRPASGAGANGLKSLTSSLQSPSHTLCALCFSARCHPTLPRTSNEPQRLCPLLPNYKLCTCKRAHCHPLKLLNYGHWHQVWKLPLSPPTLQK